MDVDKLFDLSNQVAIVTGASAGLGQVFAETLASKGAKLALCARRAAPLRKFADALKKKYNVRVFYEVVDVTDEKQASRFCASVFKTYGKIDILVNNVGTSGVTATDQPTFTISKERFSKEVEKNLHSCFIMSREAGKYMAKRHYGKIINLSSVLGIIASKGWYMPAYYASKGGVVNLTRGLAVEFSQFGINVNTIAPGTFPSESTKKDIFNDKKVMRYIESLNPLHRLGKPDDLKGVVLLLASHASDYITGQTISVDGGWTIW
ncbi:MAG: SDR family oxidoreductase [Candidatus Micrarchaeales archaeon]|nr:SDR family oxidoreductase [Candidatus Micrarchaeales archaeon]